MRNIAIFDYNELNVLAYEVVLNKRFIANARIHRIADLEGLKTFCHTYSSAYVIVGVSSFKAAQHIREVVKAQQSNPQMMWTFYFSEIKPDLYGLKLSEVRDNVVLVSGSDSKQELEKGFDSFLQNKEFIASSFKDIVQGVTQRVSLENKILTQVETEILREIAFGKMTKEIALERHISMHTVVSHKKNIYKKLGINNVYDATKYAIKTGVITVNDYYI